MNAASSDNVCGAKMRRIGTNHLPLGAAPRAACVSCPAAAGTGPVAWLVARIAISACCVARFSAVTVKGVSEGNISLPDAPGATLRGRAWLDGGGPGGRPPASGSDSTCAPSTNRLTSRSSPDWMLRSTCSLRSRTSWRRWSEKPCALAPDDHLGRAGGVAPRESPHHLVEDIPRKIHGHEMPGPRRVADGVVQVDAGASALGCGQDDLCFPALEGGRRLSFLVRRILKQLEIFNPAGIQLLAQRRQEPGHILAQTLNQRLVEPLGEHRHFPARSQVIR